MQRQRYTVIGTKNGYNVKDFIMAYSETEAKLLYKRSRPDVEVTECYITKVNDWHGEASMEIHSQFLRRKVNLNFEVDKREQDRIEFSNGSSIELTEESDIPIKYRGSAIHITDGDEDDSDVSK